METYGIVATMILHIMCAWIFFVVVYGTNHEPQEWGEFCDEVCGDVLESIWDNEEID